MTEEELLGGLLGIVFVLADEIYFRKCMHLNVARLSETEKKACVDEAIKALPAFLETYKKYRDALKNIDMTIGKDDK